MIGNTLSHYKIISKLGQGGQSEVYLAEDSRLDRKVALKILPQHLSERAELRERFEREARAVSSLNHPHICTLHDIGEQDGIHYLVMEHLVGETLEARLAKGPLPLEQTLEYAIQIADALDKAHRQGVVHRDLKPGNIMLVKSGAKLLDFGLAKLQQADTPTNLSALPTEQANLTAEGTILGTLQYMAPEQLEAKEADSRTDIFAFGAVVYEMATGKKAFEGNSQASLISAIMKDDPRPMGELQSMAPPVLDRVVRRCLEKEPDERWQTAADLLAELKWVIEGGSQPDVPVLVVSKRKNRERLAWGLVVVLVGLAIALGVLYFSAAPEESGSIQFSVSPSPPQGVLSSVASLSPDGRHLAFRLSSSDGSPLIWIRSLNSVEARPLLGTEQGSYPFWSPDNRFIGFFAEGKLKKIAISGGPPQTVCDAPIPRGGTWNRNGLILFAMENKVLHQVSEDGGSATPLTTLDETHQELAHLWPHFLSDDRHFIYLAQSLAQGNSRIYAGSLDSSERTHLLDSDFMAMHSSGYLLFVREQTLMAQRFDETELRTMGGPLPVAEGIGSNTFMGRAGFSVSERGVLSYRTGGSTESSQLTWYDRTGKELGSVGPPGGYLTPALSPDGTRVAVARRDSGEANSDIWILDVFQGTTSRLTFDPANDDSPTWSPDGSQIVFSSNRGGGPRQLYLKDSAGAGQEQLLLESNNETWSMSWSLDGQFLTVFDSDPNSGLDLWTMPMFDDRKPTPFLREPFDEIQGQLSPDGRWMAYSSNELGSYHVYVQNFPPSGGKWQISPGPGLQPKWRQDGKELFYINYQGELMAVDVKTDAIFGHGIPRPLFQTDVNMVLQRNSYDVTADGQRFLVNSLIQDESSPITVVVNWTAELEQ